MRFIRWKRKQVSYKEIGLAIALVLGRFFFRTDHLHYGFWTPGLEVSARNLPAAQESYSAFLLGHIPTSVKTILDVGCGSGRFARELSDRGYAVDCVSPSPVLTEAARNLLGDELVIFECRFEDLQTVNRYDAVVFSESFQYIDVKTALEKSLTLLKDGGHVLICDFFARTAGPQPMGGGHPLESLYRALAALPLDVTEDRDITAETAPTIEVANQFLNQVFIPVASLLSDFVGKHYPAARRLLRFIFRRRLAKFKNRYLSGIRTPETFARYKTYRFILCKKRSPEVTPIHE